MKAAGLLFIILFLFAGCGVDDSPRYFAVAADFPSFDALRAVIGSDDGILMLLPPGTESHGYEPTPKDMIAVSDADIVVYTGGHSQDWMDRLLSASDDPPFQFRLIDQVSLLAEESREGMEGAEHHHGIDEHVWTSLENMASIVSGIRDEMAAIDPLNEASYRANADSYVSELNDIRDDYERMIENSDRRLIVVADRFPFLYLVREFGLDYYAAFPGCASGSEPSARTISFLIDKVKEKGIPVVFHIELSNTLIAELVADETGANVRELNSAQNISRMDFNDGLTYLDIMRGNLSVLEEALN